MDEATPLTPFDTMTQTREIQMLKTVIPYMKSSQKKQFAILIKYMELQNTLHIFSQEEQVLSMCCSGVITIFDTGSHILLGTFSAADLLTGDASAASQTPRFFYRSAVFA